MTNMDKAKEVNIQVIREEKRTTIICKSDESLMAALDRQGYYISAVCGGRGTCGKCKIKVIDGDLKITTQDEKKLKQEELDDGYRLSCMAYPEQDCSIELFTSDESDFEIITDMSSKTNEQISEDHEYGFAVDIGTTTIAISLVGLNSKNVLKTHTTINKQRAYGADVVARMQASNQGQSEILRNSIRVDLTNGFKQLVKDMKIDNLQVKQIAIAGNTTMGHLLMGYSCKTLGEVPFVPVNIKRIEESFEEIFASDDFEALVTLVPGISAFVGADVVAGLVVTDFDKSNKLSMLVDLGTNGEMAIGTKDNLIVTSTAAGPAFEGGNISHGVGSIAGAISDVYIGEEANFPENNDKIFNYKNTYSNTIGNKTPVGICGTGVIASTSELIRNGIADENGLLEDPYFEEGYPIYLSDEDEHAEKENGIYFTQKDIREIQLAKAAVRGGIETLMLRYGVTHDEIDTVYLAGGFGFKLDIEKATNIGLLPKQFRGKIKTIGNGSLAGAVKYLIEEDAKNRFDKIASNSKELNLASDKDFFDIYVDSMAF